MSDHPIALNADEALAPALQAWQDAIMQAARERSCLQVRGLGSKDHVGCPAEGALLSTSSWQGVVAYEPSELVLTARAGTTLAEVEALLGSRGQYLAFEPPRGPMPGAGTVGGMVAAGLSGPSRAMRGAVRDHVLGVRMLNGRGQHLRFGGTVMKNVAGFDVSRLMAGSMGTLGVLTEVSLKVLPQPVASLTLHGRMDQAQAIRALNLWAAQPLPLDACCWHQGQLWLRLRGAKAAVDAARGVLSHAGTLAGEDKRLAPWPGGVNGGTHEEADAFWTSLRDQQHAFFAPSHGQALWRVSVPGTQAPGLPGLTDLPGDDWLIEWMGGQRWWRTATPAAQVIAAAQAAGGHAVLWQVPAGTDPQLARQLRAQASQLVWQQRPPVWQQWHRQVQRAFDPDGVFDTARLWPRRTHPI